MNTGLKGTNNELRNHIERLEKQLQGEKNKTCLKCTTKQDTIDELRSKLT